MRPRNITFRIFVLLGCLLATMTVTKPEARAELIEIETIQKDAEQGHADAQCNLGLLYALGQGVPQDYQKAVPWLTKAAEQGVADAQSILGMMYYEGEGVPQDCQKAVTWYTKAAEQREPKAQFNLGVLYANGECVQLDYRQAADWYTKAAEQGNAGAQFELGLMYAQGQGVPQNYQQAVTWCTKAAELGNARAQYNLGSMYNNGAGVPQDHQTAVTWYIKAAEQEYTDAQFALGYMYSKGQGISPDPEQAARWCAKAAKQGHTGAQFMLGVFYSGGLGVTQDYQQGVAWFTRAAEQGHVDAQSFLGGIYKEGKVVPKNLPLAVEWYSKAAEQGSALAQEALGHMYESGTGLPQNYQQAVKWYTKAVAQGSVKSEFFLGIMYYQGRGVPKDFGLAYALLNLAYSSWQNELVAKMRESAASELTPQQLAEAQTMLISNVLEKINHPEVTQAAAVSLNPSEIPVPEKTFSGSGSGFIITSDGYILTCAHVVNDANAIKVKLGERVIEAKIIRRDPASDLALLKVSTTEPLPIISFAQSRSATLGQDVFTIGFPNPELQGVAAKLTKGSVSSLSGVLDDPRLYQISVPVQPGNSGGPLLDNNGNVVGVVSAQIKDIAALKSSGSLPQSINYAVKSAYALSLIDSLPEVAKKLPTPDGRSRTFAAAASAAESSVVLVLVYE